MFSIMRYVGTCVLCFLFSALFWVTRFLFSVLCIVLCTSYFRKGCHGPNSRYWNRKELWDSSSSGNLLLLALILDNAECRFIIMSRLI